MFVNSIVSAVLARRMDMAENLPAGWSINGNGAEKSWFRRFEFPEYARLRRFLDGLAELAEATGVHPDNIGFGKDYANVSLTVPSSEEEQARLGDFVSRLDRLFEEN